MVRPPAGNDVKYRSPTSRPRSRRRRPRTDSPTSAVATASPARRRRPTSLLDLPHEVLELIFLYVVDAPHLSRSFANRSLQNFDYALWLARAHPRLMMVFRRTIDKLIVLWNDPVGPDDVALLSPSLRELSVVGHSLAARFLNSLVKAPPLLLRVLHLGNVAVLPEAFRTVVSATRLRSLSLSFVTIQSLPVVLVDIAPHLAGLTQLRLRGLSNLDDVSLLTVCRSVGKSLCNLSLRYLRHVSLNDQVLQSISAICPNVTDLNIEDVRHTTRQGVFDFCWSYRLSLTCLRLRDVRFSLPTAVRLLGACAPLREFALQDMDAAYENTDDLVNILIDAQSSLETLDLRSFFRLHGDEVYEVVRYMRNLKGLTLRRGLAISPSAWELILLPLRGLRNLNLRGTYVTDETLSVIGECCPHLEEIALGGDGHELTVEMAAQYDPYSVSNHGMEKLLEGCGESLREFFWETPRTVLSLQYGFFYRVLGVEELVAKGLAVSLRKHCRRLQRVEVNWLRPQVAQVAQRAACDLAFIELDESNPRLMVYLDTEPL